MAYIGRTTDGFGVRQRFLFTPDAGATSVSGTDANGATLTFSDSVYMDVFLNGVLLKAGTDYNTNTANTIAGLTATVANDEVTVLVYDIFTTADMVSATSGGTFTGAVTFNGSLTSVNGTFTGDVSVADDLTVTDDVAITGKTGMGISSTDVPDGGLHVHTGSAGSVSAHSVGDELVIESSGRGGISILTPDANESNILFGSPSDNLGGFITYKQSNTTMEIGTSISSGLVKINTGDGSLHTTFEADGDLNIKDGNLVLDSGHGIDFSDTANSSVTGTGNQAELLADYEKGTWTPNDASGANITYAQKQGSYIKIGDQVTAWGYINTPSSVTHTGAIQINGLPFTTASAGDASSGTSARGGGMIAFQNTGDQDVYVLTIRDSQQIEFFNENGQNHSNNLLNGSKTIMFAVTYHTGIA